MTVFHWQDALANVLALPGSTGSLEPDGWPAGLFDRASAPPQTILDSDLIEPGPDPAFDRLLELAKRLLRAPAGGIALLSGGRECVRSQQEIALEDAQRGASFCLQALAADDVFVVEDARADPRFAGNAILTRDPRVRFYAGIALAVDGGRRIGTLFVVDRRPRRLTTTERNSLRLLAGAAEDAIRLRCSLGRLSEMSEERRRQVDVLNVRSRQLAQAQRIAQLGIFTYDYALDSSYVSTLACKIIGLPRGAPLSLSDFLAAFGDADREKLSAVFRGEGLDGHGFSLECDIALADGARRSIRLVGEVTLDQQGPARLFGTLQDITQERVQRQALQHLAECDALTGVYNRTVFDQKIRQSLADAGHAGKSATLFLIDVDNLKEVNDMMGHPAGDDLLRAIASGLAAVTRETDLVFRVGGDEFAVLAPGIGGPADLADVRARLTAALNRPVQIADRTIALSCSIGEAVFPRDTTARVDLYQAADTALIEAKRRGKGRCVSFEPWLRDRRERHRVLLTEARDGLARDQFVPHFQPKMELATRRLVGFEALARWDHPEKGVIGPFFFHDLFDDREVGGAVSNVILAKSVETAASLNARGVKFGHIAVNLNSAQLEAADFASTLADRVAEHDVAPGQIRLEIVENTLIAEQRNIAANLRRLALAGFDISLDDFGTGYASLTHIRESYIREIKIDRSFVIRTATSQQDLHILSAIISLARGMNLGVVAEGIETEAALHLLTDLGCTAGQGFLIGRPMPLDELGPFLVRQSRIDALRQTAA